jgi:hypothetical protein
VEAAGLVDPPVGVRPEQVALPLHQGGREPLGPQGVVVAEADAMAGAGTPVSAASATTVRQAATAPPIAAATDGWAASSARSGSSSPTGNPAVGTDLGDVT